MAFICSPISQNLTKKENTAGKNDSVLKDEELRKEHVTTKEKELDEQEGEDNG